MVGRHGGKGTVTRGAGQVVGPYHYLPQFLQSSRGGFLYAVKTFLEPPMTPNNSGYARVTAW